MLDPVSGLTKPTSVRDRLDGVLAVHRSLAFFKTISPRIPPEPEQAGAVGVGHRLNAFANAVETCAISKSLRNLDLSK